MSVNDAPISNDFSVDMNEDETTSIVLQASDVDGDPLVYSVISNPSGSIVSIEGSIVTYIPNLNFVGGFRLVAAAGNYRSCQYESNGPYAVPHFAL